MKYIISWSGGKDSTVLLLEGIKRNMPIDYVVFSDTTFEFPEMYDYIEKIQNIIDIPITILKPATTFDDWFYGIPKRGQFTDRIRGFPYQCNPCYWQRESKVKPKEKFLKQFKNEGYKQYIGYTTDEKHRIMKGDEFIYPLIDWGFSEKDCLNYLKNRNLLNPLYNKFDRTGCFWCHKQPKKSLEVVYREYPEQWKWIKKYEKDSPHGYRNNFSCEEFEKID